MTPAPIQLSEIENGQRNRLSISAGLKTIAALIWIPQAALISLAVGSLASGATGPSALAAAAGFVVLALLRAGLGAVSALAALDLYTVLGAPQAPDQPLAGRKSALLAERAEAGDLNSRIAILVDKTKENSDSFEDWWLLGRSYVATGDHASAVDAYRHAEELSGDRPAVLSAYAEPLTLANGNKVPQAARLAFEQILQNTPDPRARYYIALAKAQSQDFEGAIESWSALARDSQPGAPWMPLVRRDTVNMARFLDKDVTVYLPDATGTEIAKAGAKAADTEAHTGRIETLAAALDADPMDHKGWIEVTRLYAALGRDAEAAVALAKARGHFAAAPFVLGKIDDAARDLGLDMLKPDNDPRGPDAADIAVASTMTEDDRTDMIAGMVAGFAARLEESPRDPDGWVMLIRSYAVLGENEKAREAYERATAVYAEDEGILERVRAATEATNQTR